MIGKDKYTNRKMRINAVRDATHHPVHKSLLCFQHQHIFTLLEWPTPQLIPFLWQPSLASTSNSLRRQTISYKTPSVWQTNLRLKRPAWTSKTRAQLNPTIFLLPILNYDIISTAHNLHKLRLEVPIVIYNANSAKWRSAYAVIKGSYFAQSSFLPHYRELWIFNVHSYIGSLLLIGEGDNARMIQTQRCWELWCTFPYLGRPADAWELDSD